MRKSKTIKIDDKEITVKELDWKDIIGIFNAIGPGGIVELAGHIRTFLPKLTQELSLEDLEKMAPSETMQIIDAVKEVNSNFLLIARFFSLDKIIKDLKEAILKDFSDLLADSLNTDTPTLSNTDTPFLKSPLKNAQDQKPNAL